MIRFFWPVFGLFIVLQIACAASEAAADIPSIHLSNYEIVDLKGNSIAQVEDVLIASDSGQITYALVILERGPFSYGKAAFSEASEPHTAVPWEYFLIDSTSAQLQFRADRSVLYEAPLLVDEPNHLETGWDANIRAYWQAYPLSTPQE